jgi:hypothetical protein
MKMRVTIGFLAFALLLGLAAGFAPRASAADALPQTKQPSSARFEIAGSIEAGGSTITMTGGGAMVGANVQEDLTMQLPGSPQALSMSIILLDGKMYYRMSGLGTTGADQWYVMDLGPQLGGMPGTMPMVPGMSVPMPNAAYEAAFTVKNMGQETVNGAATTHYHIDVDLAKLYSLMGMTGPEIDQLTRNLTMVMHMWVGNADQYLHKMQMLMNGSIAVADQPPVTIKYDLTMTFRDFDTAISIVAPPNATPLDTNGGLGGLFPSLTGGIAMPGMPTGSSGTAPAVPVPGMPRTGGPADAASLPILLIAGLLCLGAGAMLRRRGANTI